MRGRERAGGVREITEWLVSPSFPGFYGCGVVSRLVLRVEDTLYGTLDLLAARIRPCHGVSCRAGGRV